MNSQAQHRGCDGRKGVSRMQLTLALALLLFALGSCKELTEDEVLIELSDNGLDGYCVVPGNAAVAEETAFKERLVSLLKEDDQSLAHLQSRDIEAHAASPYGKMWSAVAQRNVLADGETNQFVPDLVRLDFSARFNHSRGISQRALQRSLKHFADSRVGALASTPSDVSRRMVAAKVCDEAKHQAACKESCKAYMGQICDNCKCGGEHRGGTAQCICVLHAGIFYNLIFSNSIYAVAMLLFGLCARSAVLKFTPLESPYPNIGGEEFESDVLAFCTNMNVTCMVCCCPAVRVAMTYYYAGYTKGYLFMLIFLCVLFGVPGMPGMGIFMVVLFLGRRFIRKAAPLNKDLCGDICCICCCTWCIVCQEARHIDKCMEEVAKKQLKASGDLVGMAVALEDKM